MITWNPPTIDGSRKMIKANDVTRAGVVGAGTMGNGIAHTFALHGIHVTLVDVDKESLERAVATIEKNLERQIQKGTCSDSDAVATLQRIEAEASIESLSDVEVVIEAATESPALKFKLFETLSSVTAEDALLATNTSSISITEIAARVNEPSRVIGMHFMNPVPVMQLVEVIRGLETSDGVTQFTMDLCERVSKVPVLANDYPGFVANRVLMPMVNEALYCVMEGVAEPDAVDSIMQLGMNHPMGPLALADLIGLDTCLAIMDVLHQGLGDSKYRPCPLLRKYVAAGRLGRKSGRGVFEYRET